MPFSARKFLALLLLLFLAFPLLWGCSEAPADEETIENDEPEELSPEHQAMLDALQEELDRMGNEPGTPATPLEDPSENRSSGSSTGSTGTFKHEVNMDIDGVIEENQDEGWWKSD